MYIKLHISYDGYSAAPDPRKKSIVRLYKLRRHAVLTLSEGDLYKGGSPPELCQISAVFMVF